jgi:hypothetical protein
MRTAVITGLGAALATCLGGTIASAQDTDPTTTTTTTTTPYTTPYQQRDISEQQRGVNPPRNAFELTLRGGYSQGFGRWRGGSGGELPDLANAGGNIELGTSYRMTPRSSAGVLFQYGQYSGEQSNTTVRGFVTGLDYTFHIRPGERVDPWVSAGVGYRFLWNVPDSAPNTMLHGFQLARITAGLDAVVTDDLAFGPYVGADLNMFLWQVGPGPDGEIPNNGRVSTFVSAGVSGRFDIGGTRDRRVPAATYTGLR